MRSTLGARMSRFITSVTGGPVASAEDWLAYRNDVGARRGGPMAAVEHGSPALARLMEDANVDFIFDAKRKSLV